MILTKLPKLTSLSSKTCIMRVALESFFQHTLPVNTNITTLDLRNESLGRGGNVDDQCSPTETQNSYEILIKALPNLKHLKCNEITRELFLFLVQALPDLETLEITYFNIYRLPDYKFLPNLKLSTLKIVANVSNKGLFLLYGFSNIFDTSNFAALVRKEIMKHWDLDLEPNRKCMAQCRSIPESFGKLFILYLQQLLTINIRRNRSFSYG